jgi:hypothetical protein
MPFLYHARFAECVRAHTALVRSRITDGTWTVNQDEPALLDALVTLAVELGV